METTFFYILQGGFCLLYIIEFILWHKLRSHKSYSDLPKSNHHRYVPLYVMVVLAIIVAGAFITDDPAKFRLTIVSVLITPVLSIQIQSALVYVSVIRQQTAFPKSYLEVLGLRCRLILKCASLFYLVLIPMLIIYLM